MIKSIKKSEAKHLSDVFTYKNRTVAIRYYVAVTEVENDWTKAQLELASEYQYEKVDGNIWDYYLVFLCAFDQNSIDSELRFKIESDRFCCRKMFLFGVSQKTTAVNELVCKNLFPEIEKSKPIQVIQPADLFKKIKSKMKVVVGEEFFTREMSESQIESIVTKLLDEDNGDE